MGCAESRYESRARQIDDLNSAPINFIGGNGYKDIEKFVHCPADGICMAAVDDADPLEYYNIRDDSLQAKNEAQMKRAFKSIVENIEFKKEQLNREFKRSIDLKAQYTGQKYNREEAVEQINMFCDTIKRLSGLAPKQEDDEELNEDEQALSGWENFPRLCLQLVFENPYVFDLMKYDVMKWEFNLSEYPKKHNERHMGVLSAIVGSVVRLGALTEAKSTKDLKNKKIWFSGFFGDDDFQVLMEALPERKTGFWGQPINQTQEDKVKDGKVEKTKIQKERGTINFCVSFPKNGRYY